MNGRLEGVRQPQVLGTYEPWLFTTYVSSWDDPPSNQALLSSHATGSGVNRTHVLTSQDVDNAEMSFIGLPEGLGKKFGDETFRRGGERH